MLAPSSIASLYGSDLAQGAGVSVDGVAAKVFFAAQGQINFLVPDGATSGLRQVLVIPPDGSSFWSTWVEIAQTAPALFTANA